jgi:hypothetical protein
MAFVSAEMTNVIKDFDTYEFDECLGCETGVDYIGAHLDECGKYNKFCCTRAAEAERTNLNNQKLKPTLQV